MSPASASSSKPSTFSSVLLPEPDGPSTTTSSPRRTSRSAPASTSIGGPLGAGKRFTSPCALTTVSGGTAPPNGLGRRQAHDAQRRVRGGGGAEEHREDERAAEQPRREEEQLLAAAAHPAIDPEPEPDRQKHAEGATRERHREGLAQDLATEVPVGGPERTLDAEVADALEDGRRHRVGEREAADHECEQAEADEQRREERGRLTQQRRQLP